MLLPGWVFALLLLLLMMMMMMMMIKIITGGDSINSNKGELRSSSLPTPQLPPSYPRLCR
jgi:hypothetical protein